MVVEHVFIEDKKKWEDLISIFPHNIFQSWQYCKSIGDSLNVKVELLVLKTNHYGLALTFVRRSKDGLAYDIYSPYGFGGMQIWGDADLECFDELEKWFNSNQIITAFLMLHPSYNYEFPLIQNYRTSFVVDLTIPENVLWSNLSSGHKYEINKVKKLDNWALVGNKEYLLSSFIQLYRETVSRVEANELYNFLESSITDLVNLDDSLLLGCEEDGVLKAAILILVCGEVAEYFINASSEEGKKYSRVLLWNAMVEIKRRGVKQFNMGGGIKEGDSLEDFKKRMGGKRQTIPVFKNIISMSKYNLLCESCGANPDDKSYFPPYWKK